MPDQDQLEITEAGCQQRQQFLGIGDADRDHVRTLKPAFAACAQEFAERFYQHLLSHPYTARFLQDPAQLERLKQIQIRYFSELLEGVFDGAYLEGRLRVGRTHQQVGLEPTWYLGAYNQYIQITFPIFAQAFGNDLDKVLPLFLSLVKVIFLDIDLALHTYYQTVTEYLRQHNEELRQALRLYWQAHRREEQLRRLLSHEVRGGLAAVITSLEDLREVADPVLDTPERDDLEEVTRRCWSLSNLLREMLAPAEITGPTWVDCGQLFDALRTRFSLYTEGRDVQFLLPTQTPRVWADPIQLREVLANLVSNAVRYLDKEPGRVEISTHAEERHQVFTVADNGPGIPENIRSRLFEPFVRGASPQGRPAGTGLGLYFVRSIIEQGGGRVWIDSSPGEGTRVHFTVPKGPPGESASLIP
jgi:signal transduction histidine kinase